MNITLGIFYCPPHMVCVHGHPHTYRAQHSHCPATVYGAGAYGADRAIRQRMWPYPVGLALAIPFLIVWLKGGMGAGDVKLLMGIGLYLGLAGTLMSFALMLPCMAILLIRSWIWYKTLKTTVPFAPVLAFGAGAVVLVDYILSWISLSAKKAEFYFFRHDLQGYVRKLVECMCVVEIRY